MLSPTVNIDLTSGSFEAEDRALLIKKGLLVPVNDILQVTEAGAKTNVQTLPNKREIFVFDQVRDKWFRWSYSTLQFVELKEVPEIGCENFAGIGTRELKPNGEKAILDVYEKTYKNKI